MEKNHNLLSSEASLPSLIESILFVASGPVSIGRLSSILEITPSSVSRLLEDLDTAYEGRGIRLQWSGGNVQLTTAPECAHVVERFLGLELTTRLSHAALETLAIVAFLQPVTRPHIDQIRGVNSDSSIRTLLSVGLLEEVGRQETPGRPILYGTTPEFLQYFGLRSLEELPDLEEEDVNVH